MAIGLEGNRDDGGGAELLTKGCRVLTKYGDVGRVGGLVHAEHRVHHQGIGTLVPVRGNDREQAGGVGSNGCVGQHHSVGIAREDGSVVVDVQDGYHAHGRAGRVHAVAGSYDQGEGVGTCGVVEGLAIDGGGHSDVPGGAVYGKEAGPGTVVGPTTGHYRLYGVHHRWHVALGNGRTRGDVGPQGRVLVHAPGTVSRKQRFGGDVYHQEGGGGQRRGAQVGGHDGSVDLGLKGIGEGGEHRDHARRGVYAECCRSVGAFRNEQRLLGQSELDRSVQTLVRVSGTDLDQHHVVPDDGVGHHQVVEGLREGRRIVVDVEEGEVSGNGGGQRRRSKVVGRHPEAVLFLLLPIQSTHRHEETRGIVWEGKSAYSGGDTYDGCVRVPNGAVQTEVWIGGGDVEDQKRIRDLFHYSHRECRVCDFGIVIIDVSQDDGDGSGGLHGRGPCVLRQHGGGPG